MFFSFPWLLLLLPLPWLIRYLIPAYLKREAAIKIPWFDRAVAVSDRTPAPGAVVANQSLGQLLFLSMAWIALVCALARPQILEPPISKITPTRDLLLLVDLSGSMETVDFTNQAGKKVDRLSAVKEVLDDFLTKREGDRVGLVVFGNAAFVQIPFTQDLDACRQLLNETAVRMAGPKTAFGDAIGLGISLFEKSEINDKVMIALTDGNDTGSKIPPYEAAKIAADREIVIHVVGAGDPTTTGEDVFDEAVLKSVAKATRGKYFHGENREALIAIYDELDKLSTREVEKITHRPTRDLFIWPLMAALLFHVMSILISNLSIFAPKTTKTMSIKTVATKTVTTEGVDLNSVKQIIKQEPAS